MGMPQKDAIVGLVSFLQLVALRCKLADADPRSGMETQSPIVILITGCFFGEGCTGNMHFNFALLGSGLCQGLLPLNLEDALFAQGWAVGQARNRGCSPKYPSDYSTGTVDFLSLGGFCLIENQIFLSLRCRALATNYWLFWSQFSRAFRLTPNLWL